MGSVCSGETGGKAPRNGTSTIEPEPSFDHIVRGHFLPQQNGDLKVHEGDSVRIIDRSADEAWLKVELQSNSHISGWVPAGIVVKSGSIETEEFYAGYMSRIEAAEKLKLDKEKGNFVVRKNQKHQFYCVSCLNNDKIYNYKITKDPVTGQCSIFPGTYFDSIKELVEFYQSESIKDDEILLKKGVSCDLSYHIRPRDAWKIDPVDLMMQYLEDGVTPIILGQGCFGRVYAGYLKVTCPIIKKDDKIEVAIKELKMDQTDEFTKESEAMKKLSHDRLLMLYGITYEKPLRIVMEFMHNGSLLKYLQKGNGRNWSTATLERKLYELCEGMEYIEMKKFVHRDVRADNVLVNGDEQVKIADFGLARDETYEASETSKYPVRWASPEVLSMRLFSSKADVWSFGVMITEVMTYGQKPYPSMNIEKVFHHVSGEKIMNRPEGLGDAMWNVCLGTWTFDPAKRPPFYKVRKYLEEIVEAGLGNTDGWTPYQNQEKQPIDRRDSKLSYLGYSGFNPDLDK